MEGVFCVYDDQLNPLDQSGGTYEDSDHYNASYEAAHVVTYEPTASERRAKRLRTIPKHLIHRPMLEIAHSIVRMIATNAQIAITPTRIDNTRRFFAEIRGDGGEIAVYDQTLGRVLKIFRSDIANGIVTGKNVRDVYQYLDDVRAPVMPNVVWSSDGTRTRLNELYPAHTETLIGKFWEMCPSLEEARQMGLPITSAFIVQRRGHVSWIRFLYELEQHEDNIVRIVSDDHLAMWCSGLHLEAWHRGTIYYCNPTPLVSMGLREPSNTLMHCQGYVTDSFNNVLDFLRNEEVAPYLAGFRTK